LIEIDSFDFTNEEREEACAFVRNSGYDPKKICARFLVAPVLEGSVAFTFERWLWDENDKLIIEPGADSPTRDTPVMVYASDRLGWLQHFLTRTGRTIDG
jgi:hypothetical protein